MNIIHLTAVEYNELLRLGHIQVGETFYEYNEEDIFIISADMADSIESTGEKEVQNKVIKKYIDDKIVIENELSNTSTNLVTPAAVIAYLNSGIGLVIEPEVDPSSTNTTENRGIKLYIDSFIKEVE